MAGRGGGGREKRRRGSRRRPRIGVAGRPPVAAGHLDGQQRPLSDRDDRPGRHRLVVRRLDHHARQVRPEHPQGGRLSCQPQPQQRPDRRPDARRPLHLRPRLRHALSLASAGRRGRRRAPRATDRRAHPGGGVHRPGADRRPAAGATSAPRTAADSTKARPPSPRCKGFAAAATPAFPCPRKSSTRRSTTSRNAPAPTAACGINSKGGGGGRPPITAAAIACLFNAGDYDSEYVPKLLDYCQKNLDNISNQGFGHWHYAHYYYAQVLYREGGKSWEAYRDKIFARLVSEAGSDGSWNQGYIGPVFTTAINLTILQLPKGALPIYQR